MTFDAKSVFLQELAAAVGKDRQSSGFPVTEWFRAGNQSPEQTIAWWQANGPGLVQKYIDWYESARDVSVWVTPDGEPAIELDLTVKFGEVELRCIIDQVLIMGTALVVVDLKSGNSIPDNLQQLGIYASCVELAYGIRPKYGTFFMPRKDPMFLTPVCLDTYQYSVEYLTHELEMFDHGVRSGVFVASPGKQCDRCGVAQACPAMGVKPREVASVRQ